MFNPVEHQKKFIACLLPVFVSLLLPFLVEARDDKGDTVPKPEGSAGLICYRALETIPIWSGPTLNQCGKLKVILSGRRCKPDTVIRKGAIFYNYGNKWWGINGILTKVKNYPGTYDYYARPYSIKVGSRKMTVTNGGVCSQQSRK